MTGTVDVTAPAPVQRVSTLELFFDLVFVFTVTQLTAVLTPRPVVEVAGPGHGHARADLVDVRRLRVADELDLDARAAPAGDPARRDGRLPRPGPRRPGAFHGSGLAFGVGYFIVIAVHASLFIWTASAQSSRAFLGIAPYNLFNAALVIVGGALGGTAQAVLWTAAARPRVVDAVGGQPREPEQLRDRPRATSSSATGWWSSSPSASRSWRPGSAPPDCRWTPSSCSPSCSGCC